MRVSGSTVNNVISEQHLLVLFQDTQQAYMNKESLTVQYVTINPQTIFCSRNISIPSINCIHVKCDRVNLYSWENMHDPNTRDINTRDINNMHRIYDVIQSPLIRT